MISPSGKQNNSYMSATFDDRFASPSAGSWPERLRQYRTAILVGVGAIALAGIVIAILGKDEGQVRVLPPALPTVTILVPPAPPPPPPQQKMIEQPKVEQPEFQEQQPIDELQPLKEADSPEPPGPPALDTKATTTRGDMPARGSGTGSGTGNGDGRTGAWTRYAALVQMQLRSALEANKRTRKASMRGNIRLWADESGRVTRIQLVGSTGDPELDSALRDDVFSNLVLREPPPKNMPMPIVVRITEQRPG